VFDILAVGVVAWPLVHARGSRYLETNARLFGEIHRTTASMVHRNRHRYMHIGWL